MLLFARVAGVKEPKDRNMAAKSIFGDVLAGKMRKNCAVRAIPTAGRK